MLLDRIRHIGFTDGHVPFDGIEPVEGMGNGAAACVGHECFQPNHLFSYPFWFGQVAGEGKLLLPK